MRARSPRSTGAGRARQRGELIVRGPRVLDPASGLDESRDVVVRRGEIAELAEAGSGDAARRRGRSRPRVCTSSPPSSTRTSTCGPPAGRTRRTSRPEAAPPPRAATAGSPPWRTPTRRSTAAADVEALRERAAREAAVPIGFMACVTRGMRGEELTDMLELREVGAVGFSDDGLPVEELARPAPRPSIPGDHRGADRPARGGPGALRRRRHARGRGLRRARARRHPDPLGVDHDRPRCADRRLRRTRASTSSTCRAASRSPP